MREFTSVRFKLLAASMEQRYVSHCYTESLTLERPDGTKDKHAAVALLLTTTHLLLFRRTDLSQLLGVPFAGGEFQ